MREMRQAYLEYLYRKEKKMQTHTHTRFYREKFTKRKKKERKIYFQEKSIWLSSDVLVKHNERLERSVVRVRRLLLFEIT